MTWHRGSGVCAWLWDGCNRCCTGDVLSAQIVTRHFTSRQTALDKHAGAFRYKVGLCLADEDAE